MIPQNTDQLLRRLEKQASDELSYLEAIGASYFSTAQLLRLQGHWEIKNRLFWQFQRLLVWVAATAPGWLFLWFVFDLLQWKWLSLLSLTLCPLSFIVFFAGLAFMYKFFKSRGHLESVGIMIELELMSRRISLKDTY